MNSEDAWLHSASFAGLTKLLLLLRAWHVCESLEPIGCLEAVAPIDFAAIDAIHASADHVEPCKFALTALAPWAVLLANDSLQSLAALLGRSLV